MQSANSGFGIRHALRRGLTGLLFGALMPMLTHAGDEPVTIRATDVELNQKTGVATYRGHVVMTQGNMTLNADWLEATSRGRDIDTMRAGGNPARVSERTDGDITTVTAARLLYRTGVRTLELTDNVVLRRGTDVLRGTAGVYDLNSGRFELHGDRPRDDRVYAVIQPRPETPAP